MRSNWTPELEAITRCVPQRARLMVEAAVVTLEDKIATHDEWSDADSLTGVEVLANGGVRIAGTGGTLIEKTGSGSTFATDLDWESPVRMGRIVWNDHPDDFAIEQITCYLDPDTGGGKQVQYWGIRVWALMRVEQTSVLELTLSNIADLWVEAGVAAGDVDFDFSAAITKPRPNQFRPERIGTTQYPAATTFVQIFALKSDGYASNVAWMGASGSVSVGNTKLDGVELTASQHDDFGGYYVSSTLGVTPRLRVTTRTFAQQTVAFTTNPLDLGNVPTGTVEFATEGQTPRGTSLTAQVRNDADTAWVTFEDGDTTDDLPGVGKRQQYDVQVILNTDGDATPIATLLGVREVELKDLTRVSRVVSGRHAADPQKLVAELPRFQIEGLHSGHRDFYDAWTQLLASHDIADVTLRLWWGHHDLARSKWMRYEDVIIQNHKVGRASAVIDGFSPLAYLRQKKLPVYDSVNNRLKELEYYNWTLKDASEDLRDNQLGLAGRFVGPGIEDDSTQVRKIISDSNVKREMDALAACAGGVWSTSQGRLKFFDLHGNKAVVAHFRSEDIDAIEATPGLDARQPEYFVDWGWDYAKEAWDGLLYRQHSDALAALGTLAIGSPTHIDPETGKWIATEALASLYAQRQVDTFGAGFIMFRFFSHYPHPELEIGDMVAVETEKFAIKDPTSATRAIRGWHWVQGVIIAADASAQTFAIWVRRFSDILSTATTAATTVGELQRIYTSALIADTGGDFAPTRHYETGLAQHGDAVVFDRAYKKTPAVRLAHPQPARFFVASASGSDQYPDLRPINVTTAGFTVRAVVVTGPTTTPITDGFSSARNTAAPENGDVTLTADGASAYSNLEDANAAETAYRVYFDVHATGMDKSNIVYVDIYYSDRAADPGTVWTLGNGDGFTNVDDLDDYMLSFDAALGADYDIWAKISYLVPPGSKTASIVFHGEDNSVPGVQYEKVTGGTEYSMTPNSGDRLRWEAWEVAA